MSEPSTVSVARAAASDIAELLRDELALASRELRDDLARLRPPALACAGGALAAAIGAGILLQVMAVEHPRSARILGWGLLVGGVASALFSWRAMPKRFLSRTRAQLHADAQLAHEAIS
ncbi:MAG: hypothetical protein BGO98_18745 [Myxococcales bacterium 68-20]|nr:MAG: hypothetical protein BGO98_18745 [Myxococcales bacterium 68-20]